MGGNSGGGSVSRNTLGNLKSLEEKAKRALDPRKNVFISFAHEDLDEVNLLRGQAKNDHLDLEFNDRSVHEPYDSDRAEYIRSRLADRINQSSTTIVYLTDVAIASRWVRWEVEKSLALGKRVIATHSQKGAPRTIPDWIQNNIIKVVPWNKLADEL
ncbi:TIR domain-containing protein [Bradyrhizobium canariense]|uniref:Molecular chaperone Tir n=1 Tax=Bradyrhizobium canariense TaxID=255045 RepID=A0A1X3H3Q0_9BRAD|nr:TIR domain-containing protein [Bradyrhizobium canariense]OSI68579.1 molecular chaperone Tir [Bradyrhizobium canariense]OSI78027.1 molecular chaperone Tir [Bradyrhizobium canariense]OSI89257.1 molecular chaperone Tir [Bradyrhizobium canariense]OSI93739.1 molecular chaperone Tir [Bradyrhizobium canariense]OSJ03056.1 molecular chaperone Tir [Bradyrhizobium canariense]